MIKSLVRWLERGVAHVMVRWRTSPSRERVAEYEHGAGI
jgi:hypothetical protein